jgi:aryl-phospho-beta-D-glucosidase BglC (GH1 family)
MPNWAQNQLTLSHSDPKMITRAIQAFTNNTLLNEFIPVPEDLHIVAGYLGDNDEQKELEAKQAANLAKYGYKDWYGYCSEEWGTKWDVGGNEDLYIQLSEEQVILYFDSAWSPPINAYKKMEELGFTIDAMYYESGMAFCGIYSSDDGDFYFDVPDNPDAVERLIPGNIDRAFAISENMAMWEEEEAGEENE